jgi:nitroimidazol reductase NimA-like FMN-containing flavoprotein (pyridoxamine 5'-phosphate oxidase superfamily)
VNLDDVRSEAARLGRIAYLGTVSPSGTPYVSPVAVAWIDDRVVAFVATAEAKVANLRANPAITVHWSVAEATGWDSLVLWGRAAIVDTTDGRTTLWDRMGYDLRAFEPGGPEAPTHVFVDVVPSKVVLLRQYGIGGRDEWRAAGAAS